jgi:hypothetical protein
MARNYDVLELPLSDNKDYEDGSDLKWVVVYRCNHPLSDTDLSEADHSKNEESFAVYWSDNDVFDTLAEALVKLNEYES